MSNETLADILAEIRSDEAAKVMATGLLWRDMSFQFNSWADRIEAARKRERDRQCEPKCNWSIKDALALANTLANHGLRDGNADAASSCIYSLCRILFAHGNAAALRDALVQCELFLGNVSRHGHPTLNPGDKCTACDGVDELRGMVVAALAAPARNCDRFKAADEVSAYWGANVHAVPLHGDAYAMRIDGREFATFLDWLLAPAEGGVE